MHAVQKEETKNIAGTTHIARPLPKGNYEMKIKQQEQLVNALFDLTTALYNLFMVGDQDLNSKIMTTFNPKAQQQNTPYGTAKKIAEVCQAKVDYMHAIDEHRIAVKYLEDSKDNYENHFLPGYEKKIAEALDKWDSFYAEILLHPELKEKLDAEIERNGWSLDGEHADEVKLHYSTRGNTLLSQKKFTESGTASA